MVCSRVGQLTFLSSMLTSRKKLFVFASSRADETSLAGYDGSVFTNALVKAFNETEQKDETMATLVKLTQEYTEGHHPVARMVPKALELEELVP